MTQFVLHEGIHDFLLSSFFHTQYKQRLKVNNLKIEQFATLPRKQRRQRQKVQLHEHKKPVVKNQRTNLINRTIELIAYKNRPLSQSESRRKQHSQHRNNKSATYYRRGNNSFALSVRSKNETTMAHNDEENHLWDALQSFNFRKSKVVNNRYGEGISLQLKRPMTNENNYARFAERSIRRVQQRHRRYTHSMIKNRPNTNQLRSQVKNTEALEPW